MKIAIRIRMIAMLLVMLTAQATIGDEAGKKPAKKPRPVTLSAWYNKLHAIVRKKSRPEPKNDVEKKQRYQELVAEIDKELSGKVIVFETKLATVGWKDGVASISTEDELKSIKVRPKPTTLVARRSQPFEVYASQEEAAEMRKGAQIRVEAKVVFHPRQMPSSNRTHKAQALYGLTYFRLGPGYVGVFTTNSYKVSVDKREFEGRWNGEEVQGKE